MKPILRRGVVASAVTFALMPFGQAIANAYPDPYIPTWPGVPSTPPYPGAYSDGYYAGYTFPQVYTDTRGVRTGAVTADPMATGISMPGSKPGAPIPNMLYWFTNANSRYGIQGGVTAPDVSRDGYLPGMVANGGVRQDGLVENPAGTPPEAGVAPLEVPHPAPPVYGQLERPATTSE